VTTQEKLRCTVSVSPELLEPVLCRLAYCREQRCGLTEFPIHRKYSSCEKQETSTPRGLHWKPDSPFIWFNWRDNRGKQHRQSTGTDDPAEAFALRQQFLEKCNEDLEQIKSHSTEMAKWPVKRAAEEYFTWKLANSSEATVEREKRIFKPVEKFFASDFRVKAITLAHIRDYQKQRRKHVSRTMRPTGNGSDGELRDVLAEVRDDPCWLLERKP